MEPGNSDDERAAIRAQVVERNVRGAIREHVRILLAAQWPRDRVDALMRQALDEAMVLHLTRRSAG